MITYVFKNNFISLQPSEVLDPVFKSIVTLLNFPHSRQQGLQLFNSFLDQYSVLSSTGAEFLWVELLLKISNQKYPAHVLSYTILSNNEIHLIFRTIP